MSLKRDFDKSKNRQERLPEWKEAKCYDVMREGPGDFIRGDSDCSLQILEG